MPTQAIEERARFGGTPGGEQRIDQPEAADQELAFLAAQAVVGAVAQQEVAAAEFLLDGGDGPLERRALQRQSQHWREQQRSIGVRAAENLSEVPALGIHALRRHLAQEPLG